MITKQDLKNAIDSLLMLPGSAQLLQLNSSRIDSYYELYVLTLIGEAVKRAGGNVTPTGIRSGSDPAVLVFRGGPGAMSARQADFCYLACTLGQKRLEVHLDVKYEGQTGAHHEIDVSVCEAAHATSVRATGRSPRTNKPLVCAIECKFYMSYPGVVLARTFTGLTRDCASNRLRAFVSNKSSRPIDLFLGASWAPEPFTDLTPLDPDSEERFIRVVEQVLRRWSRGK